MPKKSLGQNFLSNKKILSQIVDSGNISKGDVVLEIGPGTGNLTEKILEKEPGLLLAVEKDGLLLRADSYSAQASQKITYGLAIYHTTASNGSDSAAVSAADID